MVTIHFCMEQCRLISSVPLSLLMLLIKQSMAMAAIGCHFITDSIAHVKVGCSLCASCMDNGCFRTGLYGDDMDGSKTQVCDKATARTKAFMVHMWEEMELLGPSL